MSHATPQQLDRVVEATELIMAKGRDAIMADGTRALDVELPLSSGNKKLSDATANDLSEMARMLRKRAHRA